MFPNERHTSNVLNMFEKPEFEERLDVIANGTTVRINNKVPLVKNIHNSNRITRYNTVHDHVHLWCHQSFWARASVSVTAAARPLDNSCQMIVMCDAGNVKRCETLQVCQKGKGAKAGQGKRICGTTFECRSLNWNKLPYVADTLTAVYNDILARMHPSHSTTLLLTS
jgi:hypothetical protein